MPKPPPKGPLSDERHRIGIAGHYTNCECIACLEIRAHIAAKGIFARIENPPPPPNGDTGGITHRKLSDEDAAEISNWFRNRYGMDDARVWERRQRVWAAVERAFGWAAIGFALGWIAGQAVMR